MVSRLVHALDVRRRTCDVEGMANIDEKRRIFAEHRGPKSVCECGHAGDGGGCHGGIIGHGPCTAPRCKCRKFTWASFTPELQRKLDRVAS